MRRVLTGVVDYDNNVMKMIGHDRPRIQFDGIAKVTRFNPLFGNDISGIIQPHGPIGYFSKQTFPMVGADGD